MGRIGRLWQEETAGFHGKLVWARLLSLWLPPHAGSRWRTILLRSAGFRIGEGTVFWGWPTITGSGDIYSRLVIGESCWINLGVLINVGARISIGDRVAIGHQVMILTDSHEIGTVDRRAGKLYAQEVCVGNGAWLGARALLLPGVTVGDQAVVAAGALVNKDVPPNTLVGGVPARVLRELQN